MSDLAFLLNERNWEGAVNYVPPDKATVDHLQRSTDHTAAIVDRFHAYGRPHQLHRIKQTNQIGEGDLASLLIQRRWEGDPARLERIARALGRGVLAYSSDDFDERAADIREQRRLAPGVLWIDREQGVMVGLQRLMAIRDADTPAVVGRAHTAIQTTKSSGLRGKPTLPRSPNTVLSDMAVGAVYRQEGEVSEFRRIESAYVLRPKPGSDASTPPRQRRPSQS